MRRSRGLRTVGAMPERIEIGGEDERREQPARKLTESEKRQRLLAGIGLAIVGLAVLTWLVVFLVGRIATALTAGEVYRQLQAEAQRGKGIDRDIRSLGATLSRRQVRTLVAGRSLSFERLTDEQQWLFAAIRPLSGPDAPTIEPYQVRLEDVGGGRELRLVWDVPGAGQAVVKAVRLRRRAARA